jgi:hypothetical protein
LLTATVKNCMSIFSRNLKITKIAVILVIYLLFSSPLCMADIYKYKDENGRWQFTDKKPAHLDADVVDLKNTNITKKADDAYALIDERIRKFKAKYAVQIHYQYNRTEDFPAAWLLEPINSQGEQIAFGEIDRLISISEKFVSAYPTNIIENNLKDIYLFRSLSSYGKKYGASNSLTGLYITSNGKKNGFSDIVLLSQLHSEFSSILFRNYKFPEVEWKNLNPNGFTYSGTGVEVLDQKNLYGQSSELLTKGFLVEYSKSSLENDFNMISFWLFTQADQLKNLCINNEKIKLKVDLAVEFYRSINIKVDF